MAGVQGLVLILPAVTAKRRMQRTPHWGPRERNRKQSTKRFIMS